MKNADLGDKMAEEVKNWLEIAEYDLGTAQDMLNAERFLYGIFFCQQAIEKLLKAIYVQEIARTPPRTHNLIYLAELLNLALPEGDRDFLSLLKPSLHPFPLPLETIRSSR